MHPAPSTRSPLDSFRVVATQDPERMRHALRTTYGASTFDITQRDVPFFGTGNDCAMKHSGISYCHYEAPVSLTFDETRFVRQQFGLSGAGETQLGATRLTVAPHSSCTIPEATRTRVNFAPGFRQLVVRFDVEALARKLALLAGTVPATLVFDAVADTGSREMERLRRTLFFIVGQLDLIGDATEHLEIIELEQLMMLTFLRASGHNQRRLLERRHRDAAPWQVRRAEEYIAANLERPITIEAIAAATNASVRSIFKSFRDNRGYSPMAFAKMQRLERARALLQRPTVTTTVTGVALLCGFQIQGHFARDYRVRFGELPSETLKNSR